MKLELNELLQEICSWKNPSRDEMSVIVQYTELLKIKNEETESLQKKLSFALKQNEILENSRANLFQEVTKLNGAVSCLRDSFMKIEAFEEDKRILLEERQKLRNSLESLEKLYHDQDKNMKLELQKMKEANREETTRLISGIQIKASKQVEGLERELEKKENHIVELKEEIDKLLKQKEEDILKMKVEYEDKIGKLKQQLPKSRMQTIHGLQMHDVFRQKYLKLEKESEEEILKLKEQIASLKSLTDSLRARSGSTSLSTAVLSTNWQHVKTVDAYSQTDFLQRSECCDDNDIDFMPHKKKTNKNQSVVVPQKRKLFNLSKNYYVK